jgi:hypothetical protein
MSIISNLMNENSSSQESNDIINIVKNQETETEKMPEINEMQQEKPKIMMIQPVKQNSITEFLSKYRFWIIVIVILLLLCVAGYYIYKNKITVVSMGIESPTASPPRESLINIFNRSPKGSPTVSPISTNIQSNAL